MHKISRTYCVIGDPVLHSLSPLIHNHLYSILKLPFYYHSLLVHSNSLSLFIEQSREENRPGFNVTLPYKESIIPFLDRLDPLVSCIGAVNTVINRNGKWIGYNTDSIGFRIALEQSSWSAAEKCILLGAGGAARAVVFALSMMGLKRCFIFDLQGARTKRLVDAIQSTINPMILHGVYNWEKLLPQFADSTLLVNATPVGMWPDIAHSPIPSKDLLTPEMTVFDLVPNPIHTELIRMAKAKKSKVIPGITMLVAQALASQEIWLDRELINEYFKTIVSHSMRNMNNHEFTTNTYGG
jgi:shikimate dehydrogenase